MLSSEVLDGDEAYEFTWVGKKASIVEANKPIRKTLRPCPEERGWSVEDLKTFGYWENSDYEEALIQYKAYCRNSLIAVCVLVLSLCMLAPIYLVFVFMAYRNVCKFYQALGRKEEAVFSFDLCWHVLLFFYLKEKMKEELKGIR